MHKTTSVYIIEMIVHKSINFCIRAICVLQADDPNGKKRFHDVINEHFITFICYCFQVCSQFLYAYGWVIGSVVRHECDENSKWYMKKNDMNKWRTNHFTWSKIREKKINVLFIVPKTGLMHYTCWIVVFSFCVWFCYCHYVEIVPLRVARFFQNSL